MQSTFEVVLTEFSNTQMAEWKERIHKCVFQGELFKPSLSRCYLFSHLRVASEYMVPF